MSVLIGDMMEREDVRENSHVQCETMYENRYHTVVVASGRCPGLGLYLESQEVTLTNKAHQIIKPNCGVQCTVPTATATSPS